jgi:hypothetical protein
MCWLGGHCNLCRSANDLHVGGPLLVYGYKSEKGAVLRYVCRRSTRMKEVAELTPVAMLVRATQGPNSKSTYQSRIHMVAVSFGSAIDAYNVC